MGLELGIAGRPRTYACEYLKKVVEANRATTSDSNTPGVDGVALFFALFGLEYWGLSSSQLFPKIADTDNRKIWITFILPLVGL